MFGSGLGMLSIASDACSVLSLSKDYFMSTSVDLQEQVHRIQKLHHMLEIVDNCLDLIKLEHENLIFLTQ